jgi:hypothetical protein
VLADCFRGPRENETNNGWLYFETCQDEHLQKIHPGHYSRKAETQSVDMYNVVLSNLSSEVISLERALRHISCGGNY